jgi:hypothetical protein
MIEMKIIQGMHFIPVPDIVQRSTYFPIHTNAFYPWLRLRIWNKKFLLSSHVHMNLCPGIAMYYSCHRCLQIKTPLYDIWRKHGHQCI